MNVLRLSIFLPDGPVPGWVVRLLDVCGAEPGVILVGVLYDAQPMAAADWAEQVDRLLFDRGASSLDPVSLELPGLLPVWRAEAGVAPARWLAERACDVLLDLRPRPTPIPQLAAEHWMLSIAGRPATDAGAGAQPVVGGDATTCVALERVGGGAILDTSVGATCEFSIRRNRRRALAKGIGMVRRALRRMRTQAPPPPQRDTLPAAAVQPPGAVARVAAVLGRTARRALRKGLSRDQWGIALAFGDDVCLDPARAQLILPPPDRFWADPMVWPAGQDGWWVFIEEVLYAEGRGTLQALRVHRDGRWEAPVPVMARPWHLSYPFLFWWDGALWMVPESGANRRVELYRCTRLPDRWEKFTDLLTDIDLVDATLFAHDGRWWLLGNVSEPGADKHDELHAFHAPSPLGPWTPHAANPVVADARVARPAGPVFERDGHLLRPAQVCVPEYGHALVLRRIEKLTTEEYVERTERRIDPGWLPGIACVHTLSHEAGLTAFDFLIRRSRLLPPPAALRRAVLHGGGEERCDMPRAEVPR